MAEKQFEITIEVPRWGFVKRGSTNKIDFISPIPCPYNYGSIRAYVGLDNDYLDAIVLGPRLPRNATITCPALAAIGLSDRGMYDDKVICATRPLSRLDRHLVSAFFHFYAIFKRILNFLRRQPGQTKCEGWQEIDGVLSRARECDESRVEPIATF